MYPTTYSTSTVLRRPTLGTEERRPIRPSDVVRIERDEVEPVPTERDPGVDVHSTAGSVVPPTNRGTASSAVVPGDPYSAWVSRVLAAGHPVIGLGLGRYRPDVMPIWSYAMPPNELLEAAQEYARARVDWVHVVVRTVHHLMSLHHAIQGPRPTGPRRRRGGPAGVPWRQLVAQQHIGPCAISDTRNGITVHVLDLPVSWLSCPVLRVGPPVTSGSVEISAATPADSPDDVAVGDRRPAAG